MANHELALNTIECNAKVRNGKIRIFPKEVILNFVEFNSKFKTKFNYNSTLDEVINFFRFEFNSKSILVNNQNKVEEDFYNNFFPYAYIKA